MFMQCHALHLSFLSFLSLSLLLCFLFSLLLHFSFLTMAPKKSVPSKNPIRCRGSSTSSFSLPNSIKFRYADSQKDFVENICDWVIHSERQVILSDFPKTPLLGAFNSRGSESLCEKPMRCASVFIQEFYSNMHAIVTSVPRFTTIL